MTRQEAADVDQNDQEEEVIASRSRAVVHKFLDAFRNVLGVGWRR